MKETIHTIELSSTELVLLRQALRKIQFTAHEMARATLDKKLELHQSKVICDSDCKAQELTEAI